MQPSRTRDETGPMPTDTAPPSAAAQSAGALYRQHLERFPERPADTALERAARALLRAAQFRSKAPPRAD